jgi:glycosyltransferase involved in cell wall biosynthesis
MSWRYNVVGFLEEHFGLAIAARNSVRVLSATSRLERQVTVRILASRHLGERVREEASRWWANRTGTGTAAPPTTGDEVNLLQMNPLELAWFSPQWRPVVPPGARNVCVPFWELPRLPRRWLPILGSVDAIMAPTRFVQEACAEALPRERVLHYPQAVFLPEDVRPDRAAWGISEGATVFIVSFDPGSDIERKNPWAALDAFQRAFSTGDDVQLVIKSRPWAAVTAFREQVERLRDRTAGDPRIVVVDRNLRYEEVLGLYASCDVLLSLHRSEGLGLHLMEAMSLGKPVVATGWSGNMDFMTPANSVPIGYGLVPVATAHPVYRSELGREGQRWAEVNLEEAVRAIRGLHDDRARRTQLGAAARESMADRRREVLAGSPWAGLEAVLERTPARPRRLWRAVGRSRLKTVIHHLGVQARDGLRRRGRRPAS